MTPITMCNGSLYLSLDKMSHVKGFVGDNKLITTETTFQGDIAWSAVKKYHSCVKSCSATLTNNEPYQTLSPVYRRT